MQGAAEAVNTEAIVLEAAYEDKVPPRQNVTNLAHYPSSQRTGEYVQQHSWNHGQQQP